MSKKIFIYSIPRASVFGIHDWTNDSSGVKLKKNKIGSCTDSIQALFSPKVGGLANYISYTPATDPETGTPLLNDKGQPIMLQEVLEKKWNKPSGYFNNSAYNPHLGPAENLTYFQTKSWILQDGCTVLDLNLMDDEMGYYVMLASHLVANSESEWRQHKWPRAQWYIALENESEQIKYRKNEIKSKAFAALHDSNLTDTYKRKFVSLLDLASSRASLTAEQVNNLLYDFIEKSSFTPGSSIDKFNEVYTSLSTPHGREKIEARWILKQALDNRIIYEKQDTYTWIRAKGAVVIGDRYSEAVDYLLNPKKSVDREELLEEIKAKQ